jgi:hypothetical protein
MYANIGATNTVFDFGRHTCTGWLVIQLRLFLRQSHGTSGNQDQKDRKNF